jgi:hypothetical protein
MIGPYSTGVSKDELAIATVLAHPGVSARTVIEFAPSLAPVARAAAVLERLAGLGRLDRRPGADFIEYFPPDKVSRIVGPADEVEPEEEPVEIVVPPAAQHHALLEAVLEKRRQKTDHRVARWVVLAGEFPGLTCYEMCEKRPALGAPAKLALRMGYAASKGLLDVRKGGDWGNGCRYWPKGLAPATPSPELVAAVMAMRKARRPAVRRDAIVKAMYANPGNHAYFLGQVSDPPMKSPEAFALLSNAMTHHQLVSRARKGGVWCWWPPGEAPADDEVAPARAASTPVALIWNRGTTLLGDIGVDVDELERLVVEPRPRPRPVSREDWHPPALAIPRILSSTYSAPRWRGSKDFA